MPYHDLGDKDVSTAGAVSRASEMDPQKSMFRSPMSADPVDRVACRVGDPSYATVHASALGRSAGLASSHTARSLLQLQRQFGNRYVGQVLSRARAAEGGGDSDLGAVERSIDQARGGGQGLDDGVRNQMESSFGADFGGVRIHNDAHADSLNRAVSARAFTTGKDIFFRQGEYNPGASGGRELLAHELTHVVQQNGDGIQRKMTVSQPGDPHEVEADQMASTVMQREQQSPSSADRQIVSREEDKELETKLDRQPEAVNEQDEEKKKQPAG